MFVIRRSIRSGGRASWVPTALLCLLVLISSLRVEAQSILTVAGGGTDDGGPAIAAGLNFPLAIAFDAQDNLYIMDAFNFRLRKVSATTGIISTVAGNGSSAISGDGGPATSASIGSFNRIAIDRSGNLLIAGNGVIRSVSASTGIITTVAGGGPTFGDGGLAINAQFAGPLAIAIASSGNIYVADSRNHRIRRIDAVTGIITTIAGSGPLNTDTGGYGGDGGLATAALLNYSTGLAVDAAENVFFVDMKNDRIRRIDARTRIITTIAGNGTKGFSSDGGSATNAQIALSDLTNGDTELGAGVAVDTSGNVYVCDKGNDRVRVVSPATGLIRTVAGGANDSSDGIATQSKTTRPHDVAFDSLGRLSIVCDGRVRRVDLSMQRIDTVAGTGGGFVGDGRVATSAGLLGAVGVAVDPDGNIFISDYGHNRIRKVDAKTRIISSIAGDGQNTPRDGVPARQSGISNPMGIVRDSKGNIYVADHGNNRIRKIDAATALITTVAGSGPAFPSTPVKGFSGDGGPGTSALLAIVRARMQVTSLAVDAQDNVYIPDVDNHRVRKIDSRTGFISTVAGNGQSTFAALQAFEWVKDGIRGSRLSPPRWNKIASRKRGLLRKPQARFLIRWM